MTTLTRDETDLFLSQRTFTNESKTNGSGIGDFFYAISNGLPLTNSQYNGIVDAYNNRESDADQSLLQGTDPSGSNFSISSLPNRPRPIHK